MISDAFRPGTTAECFAPLALTRREFLKHGF